MALNKKAGSPASSRTSSGRSICSLWSVPRQETIGISSTWGIWRSAQWKWPTSTICELPFLQPWHQEMSLETAHITARYGQMQDSVKPECVNCGSYHDGQNHACSKRAKYIEIRRKTSTWNQNRRKRYQCKTCPLLPRETQAQVILQHVRLKMTRSSSRTRWWNSYKQCTKKLSHCRSKEQHIKFSSRVLFNFMSQYGPWRRHQHP